MLTAAGSTTATQAQPPHLPREVWVLVGAAFVIALGFGIVAPALPTFAASFNVGVTAISLVISAFAFVRLAFAPVSGALVASFGERRVHVWGVLIVGAGTVACAFAANYWQLLTFRSLSGTGSTMFTVSSMTLLLRVAPPDRRAQASGLWATSFLLGNICGPLVGGGLVELSPRLPFLVYGVTCFAAALFSWLFLRRSTLDAAVPTDGASSVSVWQAVRHPAYRAALASNFATGWAVFGVRISLIPLFVTVVLHRASGLAGISLSVFAAGNAAALMISGRLSDRRGRKPLALAGLAISAAATCWLGFTTSVPTFLAASLIAGIGAGVLNPPQNAAVADVLGAGARGGPVLAAFQMAADIGAIAGPLVAALLVEAVSYSAAFCMTGAMAALALLAWLAAPETLPGHQRDQVPRRALRPAPRCRHHSRRRSAGRARRPPDPVRRDPRRDGDIPRAAGPAHPATAVRRTTTQRPPARRTTDQPPTGGPCPVSGAAHRSAPPAGPRTDERLRRHGVLRGHRRRHSGSPDGGATARRWRHEPRWCRDHHRPPQSLGRRRGRSRRPAPAPRRPGTSRGPDDLAQALDATAL